MYFEGKKITFTVSFQRNSAQKQKRADVFKFPPYTTTQLKEVYKSAVRRITLM